MNNLLSLPPDVLGRVFTSAHPDVKMRNGSLRLFRDLYHFGQVSKLAHNLFNAIIGSDYFKQVVHPGLSKAFSADLKERSFWLKECIASHAWEGALSISLKSINLVFDQAAFESNAGSWVVFQIGISRGALCRIDSENSREILKLEGCLEAYDLSCRPYIAYSGGDWVAVQSGSLDRGQESSIRIYSWKDKKEVKKLLLEIPPNQIMMENDHLFFLSRGRGKNVLQNYKLDDLSKGLETVPLPLDVQKFYISPSTIYLFCQNNEGCFLKIIKKKGWELASQTFTLPRTCRSQHIVSYANELLMVTTEQEQLQFTSVEWVEDKFVSKTLATFKNKDWGTLENWQFRAGHAFLLFCKTPWQCVILDLEDPEREPQITLFVDSKGNPFTIAEGNYMFAPQIVVTPFKCYHMFLHTVPGSFSENTYSKVLTIEAKPLVKGLDH